LINYYDISIVTLLLIAQRSEGSPKMAVLVSPLTPVTLLKEILMLKDDNMRTPHARQPREPHFDEPIRRWSSLPVTRERACELVDNLLTRYDDGELTDALIQLICGLMPYPPSDDKHTLDERFLAGLAAASRAFTYTRRAGNELGAYVVHLKCGVWE
jgi:hypothetical protein